MRKFLIKITAIFVASVFFATFASADEPDKSEVDIMSRHDDDLAKIFEIRDKINDIHPYLKNLHPIIIVENEMFKVFDLDDSRENYVFIKEFPSPMPVPDGVRASFPVAEFEMKPCCIITSDIFDEPCGYAVIFHEFMHCQQYLTCEPKVKETLKVYKDAMEKNDFMWELNHPFPYDDPEFAEIYRGLINALKDGKTDRISELRGKLQRSLKLEDYEYMVWQEWKEGFGRYIETQIRKRLGLKHNMMPEMERFNRVSFYGVGAKYIEYFAKDDPEIINDIERLFNVMYGKRDR